MDREKSFGGKSLGAKSVTHTSNVTEVPSVKAVKSKLPPCPDGAAAKDNTAPCRQRLKKSKGNNRKPGFRKPLKKEDGNMEAQIIEYNCEFPNRVVVRLEYLMQSTRVRLNDRLYMDEFYSKLIEEEKRQLAKATKSREKAEQKRMKKLIIEGLMNDIPPELYYLHRHPVFRVNQMLNRLKSYDTALTTNVTVEDITPVEPYEFDGNSFFKHLHDTGVVWTPSFELVNEDQKLKGKIRRAKLRLLQKRKEEAAEAMVLRVLNRPTFQTSGNKSEWEGEGLDETNDEDELLNEALKMDTRITKPLSRQEHQADRIRTKMRGEILRLQEKIKLSKLRDRQRDALLDVRRQEHEIDYLDTIDHDKIHIDTVYAERVKKRNVDEIFKRPNYSGQPRKIIDSKVHLKPYEAIFARENETKLHFRRDVASEGPLLQKLRNIYDLPGYFEYEQYEPPDNEFILDILDHAMDGDDLMFCGDEITDMFARQQEIANDYLNRKLDLSDFTTPSLVNIAAAAKPSKLEISQPEPFQRTMHDDEDDEGEE